MVLNLLFLFMTAVVKNTKTVTFPKKNTMTLMRSNKLER